jgi:hypothetical protein
VGYASAAEALGEDDPFDTYESSCDELSDSDTESHQHPPPPPLTRQAPMSPPHMGQFYEAGPDPAISAAAAAADEQGASRRKRKRTNVVCFGCMHDTTGLMDHDASNSMTQCLMILDQNIGKMEPIMMCRLAHLYFKKRVWSPGMHMWRTLEILQHLSHSDDPRLFLWRQMGRCKRDLEMCTRLQYKRTVDDSGEIVHHINTSAVSMSKMLMDQIAVLYGKDPRKMNFFQESRQIDLSGMGRMFSNFAVGRAPPGGANNNRR